MPLINPYALTDQLLLAVLWGSWSSPPDRFSPRQKWRNQVQRIIKDSVGADRILSTGSWSHGTAISGFSDVDHFIVLSCERPNVSGEALERLFAPLSIALSSDTDVFLSSPTIGIVDPYDDRNVLEYVPAYVVGGGEYLIPDQASTEWLRSNPVAHAAFINRADNRGRSVREMIRLIKAWKYASGSELSSLYLEMVTTNYCLENPASHYLGELIEILRTLKRLRLADIDDPSLMERRPLASLASELSSKEAALQLISTSLDKALRIEAAAKSGADGQVIAYTSELFDFSDAEKRFGSSHVMRTHQDPMRNRFTGLRQIRAASKWR